MESAIEQHRVLNEAISSRVVISAVEKVIINLQLSKLSLKTAHYYIWQNRLTWKNLGAKRLYII